MVFLFLGVLNKYTAIAFVCIEFDAVSAIVNRKKQKVNAIKRNLSRFQRWYAATFVYTVLRLPGTNETGISSFHLSARFLCKGNVYFGFYSFFFF